MSEPQLLQHYKLNWTMQKSIVASGLPSFIKNYVGKVFDFIFKMCLDDFQNCIKVHVGPTPFAIL